jgi:hypothetical protein
MSRALRRDRIAAHVRWDIEGPRQVPATAGPDQDITTRNHTPQWTP